MYSVQSFFYIYILWECRLRCNLLFTISEVLDPDGRYDCMTNHSQEVEDACRASSSEQRWFGSEKNIIEDAGQDRKICFPKEIHIFSFMSIKMWWKHTDVFFYFYGRDLLLYFFLFFFLLLFFQSCIVSSCICSLSPVISVLRWVWGVLIGNKMYPPPVVWLMLYHNNSYKSKQCTDT